MKGEKYFNLKYGSSPDAHGHVIMLSNNKLEVIAGGLSIDELRIRTDGKQVLFDKKLYKLTKITKERADRLREDYDNWKIMQVYTGSYVEGAGHIRGVSV